MDRTQSQSAVALGRMARPDCVPSRLSSATYADSVDMTYRPLAWLSTGKLFSEPSKVGMYSASVLVPRSKAASW